MLGPNNIQVPNGVAGSGTYSRSTNTQDNAVGLVTSRRDADGHVSFTGYDKDERVTSQGDGTGATALTAFDGAGNVTKTTGPDGNATQFGFDAADRNTLITDAVATACPDE